LIQDEIQFRIEIALHFLSKKYSFKRRLVAIITIHMNNAVVMA